MKNKTSTICLAVIAITLSGLGAGASWAQSADLVLTHGKVQTMNAGRDWQQAICIVDKRISYVGSNEGAEDCIGKDTEVVDLAGQLVLPGFIDSHMHMFYGSAADVGVNLSVADTMEKLIKALHEVKLLNPGSGAIYTRGWQNFLFPPEGPSKTMLDEIFGDRAVILGSVDGHSTWFSSAALKQAGVDKTIADPQPGVRFWERDPQSGELLGTAREGAGAVVMEKLLNQSPAMFEQRLRLWLPRANAAGLTGVVDAGMGAPTLKDAYRTLSKLEGQNKLSLRVFSSVRKGQLSDGDVVADFQTAKETYTSEMIHVTAIKLMADGVPEAHTAYMLDDYKDMPGSRGKPMLSAEELNKVVLEAEQNNISVHIHAIGGAAVRMALDAIQNARNSVPGEGKTHVIAHMDYVDAVDIPRFKALNVVPQTSIQWATVDPSYDTFVKYVGREVHDAAYPIHDILAAGGRQTFGTDWPAAAFLSTYKPLIQLETAVTRRLSGDHSYPERGEGQGISVMQAVEALTINVAYQVQMADQLGSLEVGKLADMIVLGNNIFEIPSQKIHTTPVNMTISNGKVVHDNR